MKNFKVALTGLAVLALITGCQVKKETTIKPKPEVTPTVKKTDTKTTDTKEVTAEVLTKEEAFKRATFDLTLPEVKEGQTLTYDVSADPLVLTVVVKEGEVAPYVVKKAQLKEEAKLSDLTFTKSEEKDGFTLQYVEDVLKAVEWKADNYSYITIFDVKDLTVENALEFVKTIK